eukprot:NODE_778_length_3941_cov_1.171525.p4 type:complete len:144 gc:universal NODE_778_length_3941_cov_1.171525:2298-1867(-)
MLELQRYCSAFCTFYEIEFIKIKSIATTSDDSAIIGYKRYLEHLRRMTFELLHIVIIYFNYQNFSFFIAQNNKLISRDKNQSSSKHDVNISVKYGVTSILNIPYTNLRFRSSSNHGVVLRNHTFSNFMAMPFFVCFDDVRGQI